MVPVNLTTPLSGVPRLPQFVAVHPFSMHVRNPHFIPISTAHSTRSTPLTLVSISDDDNL